MLTCWLQFLQIARVQFARSRSPLIGFGWGMSAILITVTLSPAYRGAWGKTSCPFFFAPFPHTPPISLPLLGFWLFCWCNSLSSCSLGLILLAEADSYDDVVASANCISWLISLDIIFQVAVLRQSDIILINLVGNNLTHDVFAKEHGVMFTASRHTLAIMYNFSCPFSCLVFLLAVTTSNAYSFMALISISSHISSIPLPKLRPLTASLTTFVVSSLKSSASFITLYEPLFIIWYSSHDSLIQYYVHLSVLSSTTTVTHCSRWIRAALSEFPQLAQRCLSYVQVGRSQPNNSCQV